MTLDPYLFFIVAVVYSSTGLAGGSSYLALLFLLDYPVEQISVIALICNILVSFIGTNFFNLTNNLNIHSLKWFLLGSIPAAFLAGLVPVPRDLIKPMLGICLLVTSFWIFLSSLSLVTSKTQLSRTPFKECVIGVIVGTLSGFVGVGGGIFLAPILLLFSWEGPKKISGMTSAFILFNSLAGLLGQYTKIESFSFMSQHYGLCLAVVIGGIVGPYFTVFKLSQVVLKRNTGLLILFASFRLLFNF